MTCRVYRGGTERILWLTKPRMELSRRWRNYSSRYVQRSAERALARVRRRRLSLVGQRSLPRVARTTPNLLPNRRTPCLAADACATVRAARGPSPTGKSQPAFLD